MGPFEIILIIVCVCIVAGVGIAAIVRKKQGKHDCDCGGDCAHCKGCGYSQQNKKK